MLIISNNTGYISEWYNDKGDFNNADPISVTAPNATVGINAQLAIGGSISGTVTDSNGAGIDGLFVAAIGLDFTSEYDGVTDPQGNYKIAGIPTGTYKIIFYTLNSALPFASEWYNDQGDFNSAEPIPVTAPNDTPGIDAVLTPGGSISGTVTNSEGAAGIEGVQVMLADSTAAMGRLAYSYSLTDAAGNYTLANIHTGSYKVLFWSTADYQGEWYNDKGYDFNSADLVSVTAPNDTPGIDAKLTKGSSSPVSISGKVTTPGRTGIANIHVMVFDTNHNQVSGTHTDGGGYYAVQNLSSGDYKVMAQGICGEAWYNNKGSFATADTVVLTANAPATGIDIVYPPTPITTTTTVGGGSSNGGGGGGGGGAAPVTSTTTTSLAPSTSTSTVPEVKTTTTTTSVEPPAPETTTTTSIEEAKCPLQQTLGIEAKTELDVLRSFRDTRLARTPSGLLLITLYYAHSQEITAILAANPYLMEKSRLLVLELLPIVNKANRTTKPIELTDTQQKRIIKLMQAVQEKASPKLSTTITYILEKVESGELLKELN